MTATKEAINPGSMHRNPAFSWAVAVSGASRTIYIGGQDGVDASGQVVGPTLGEQTRQALRNLKAVLAEAGATPDDVVQWRIFVADGQPIQEGFAAFQEEWGSLELPPAITVAIVAGLGVPGAVVEIEAVAVT